MSAADLARSHLRGVEAYKSARSLASEGAVFLDANESPRVLSTDAALAGMNRYPSPQPPAILAEAARYYGVAAERIVITRGADEGIDLLIRAFVEPAREEILITPPTYGVYAIAARLQGALIAEAPLLVERDFALDAARIVSAVKTGPIKLVFVCRPNNPTGTDVPIEQIEELAKELSERALVVVDEAYLEFSQAASATTLLEKYPNIVVLKTLSKAWGLAGARCGFLIADPAVAALMQIVRPPYPISSASARLVETVFNAKGENAMRRSIADILSHRTRLSGALARLSCVSEVLPSSANFMIVKFKDKDAVLMALRARGIIVRDRSTEPGLPGALRITVGTVEENDRLLGVLEKLNG